MPKKVYLLILLTRDRAPWLSGLLFFLNNVSFSYALTITQTCQAIQTNILNPHFIS